MPGTARPTAGAIRILLAEVSGLTGDFVKLALGNQSDMEIVRDVPTAAEMDAAVDAADVDVVVTLLSTARVPAAYQRLVFRSPSVSIVAISADGRHIEVYGRTLVREAALDELVQVIRNVAVTSRPTTEPTR